MHMPVWSAVFTFHLCRSDVDMVISNFNLTALPGRTGGLLQLGCYTCVPFMQSCFELRIFWCMNTVLVHCGAAVDRSQPIVEVTDDALLEVKEKCG